MTYLHVFQKNLGFHKMKYFRVLRRKGVTKKSKKQPVAAAFMLEAPLTRPNFDF